ncbi:hypothetical protein GCM10009753_44180 [Streptantibioticus ferralitis]
MLLRLAYLAATNTLALLRLLPMSDRDKDIEILAPRHQLLVLQRQVGKPTFTDTDRAVLASLLDHLPTVKPGRLPLLIRPDTILRWHRNPRKSHAHPLEAITMRSATTRGRVYRRCGCRDQQRKQLGARCPKLAADPDHGTWTFAVGLPSPPGQAPRHPPRRLPHPGRPHHHASSPPRRRELRSRPSAT